MARKRHLRGRWYESTPLFSLDRSPALLPSVLPGLSELPIPLGEDLSFASQALARRRDVADRAVKPDVVVAVHEIPDYPSGIF